MDFKDFVTRHEDIKETERCYGKCSKQYEAHQKMDEIKRNFGKVHFYLENSAHRSSLWFTSFMAGLKAAK